MRGIATLGLTVATLLLLTVPVAAQGSQEGPTLPRGPIYLTEPLEVPAGETLFIGPGTRLTGPGNVTVWGTLVVNGSEADPAVFNVQLRVLAGGRAELRQARLSGVNATALEVFGGSVELADVLFEGNARAAIVKGTSALSARQTSFRDHTGEALYVEESARVELEGVSFSGNVRGATVYSAARFHATGSDFVANGQHLVIDLGPWSVPDEDILLAKNTFRAPSATPAQLPSIVLRHDPPPIEEGAERLVRLESNRIEGAAVGIRIEGRALVVESHNDTFVDNAIGLSVQQSTIRLQSPTLGNDRDIDGSARLSILDPTNLRNGAFLAPAVAPPRAWLPWAITAGVVVLLAAAFLAPRLLGAPAAPAPLPPPPPEPAPEARPAPTEPEADLSQPLSEVERRILVDILAHPGTSQREIADRLGYTRQALHYHVKKLESRRLVVKRVEGRETRCELPPAVASFVGAGTRTGSHEKA